MKKNLINKINKRLLVRASVRFLLLIVLVFPMHYIYLEFFFENDLQKHSPIINETKNLSNCDILYLGESSNLTKGPEDISRKSISEFLDSLLPDKIVKDISKGALHADIFYVLLENISDTNTIKTVVVTMNLRSFNAQWIFSELETALMKSVVLLRNRPALLNRFLLSFKGYDIKTPDERTVQVKRKWKNEPYDLPFNFPYKNLREWDADAWENGSWNADGTRDRSKRKLTAHYVKAYGFIINPENNPRIKDFDKIVELCKNRGWNLVFNLLAENTEKAEKLLGKDIKYFFEFNRKLLIDRYQKNGVKVCDNLYALSDSLFIDQHWTTEHYYEAGRRIIAENLKNVFVTALEF
jgi:hypothetical protein